MQRRDRAAGTGVATILIQVPVTLDVTGALAVLAVSQAPAFIHFGTMVGLFSLAHQLADPADRGSTG